MGFKARVDSSLPALFCHLRTMIPRAISGCWDRELKPDRSPVRHARYDCTSPAWHTHECCIHGSHFFGLMNFPDFSSFFCIFPVFFHKLFQYFSHFSSIFSSTFPVFSPFFQCFFHRLFQVQSDPLNLCSLNSSFLLNSSGKFENFESIIIDANVKLPS